MTLLHRWKQTSLHNQLLVLAAAVGIGFTALNISIVICQVWLAKTSADEGSKQTDRLIANSNHIAASMQSAVAQNKAAMDKAVENAELDERPWLTLQGVVLTEPLAVGKIPAVRLMLHNSGKTPAVEVVMVERMAVGDKPSDTGAAFAPADFSSSFILGPNETTMAVTTADGALSADQLDAIRKGPTALFFVGTITYKDFFGKSHETRTCSCINKDNAEGVALSLYKNGNSVK